MTKIRLNSEGMIDLVARTGLMRNHPIAARRGGGEFGSRS